MKNCNIKVFRYNNFYRISYINKIFMLINDSPISWLAINYTDGVPTDEDLVDVTLDDSKYVYSGQTEDMGEN